MTYKAKPYPLVGKLLTEGIKQLALHNHKSLMATQDELAYNLGCSSNTIYSWRRGEHLPDLEIVAKLAHIFVASWGAEEAWIDEFLDKTKYAPRQAIESLKQDLFGKYSPPPTHSQAIPDKVPTTPHPHPCPYQGLSAFSTADATYFHGRQRVVEQLLNTVQQQPLTTLIGASGSGKSSLIYAGLIANLQQHQHKPFISLRPGSNPLHSLAHALIPLLEVPSSQVDHALAAKKLTIAWLDNALDLSKTIHPLFSPPKPPPHLLIIIDQFEELYTLCSDLSLRQHFIDLLLDGLAAPNTPLALLFSLRADFINQALVYPPLANTLHQTNFNLGPMTHAELKETIIAPAHTLGVSFAPGLVNRILDDVGQTHGNLPLLQFALTQLWHHQQNAYLSHAAYEQIGQVQGALTHHADAIYAELNDLEQQQARHIFTQLIRPGTDTPDTRRILTQQVLGPDYKQVVQKLITARLLTGNRNVNNEETLEIVHESLIEHWNKLKAWMDTERAFRQWQDRIHPTLTQWQAHPTDQSYLLQGKALTEATHWLNTREARLTDQEKTFIEESLKWQQALKRQKQINYYTNVGFVITILLSFIIILFVWQRANFAEQNAILEQEKRLNAERSQKIQLAQSLAAQAPRLFDEANQAELAILLAVEAWLINNQTKANLSPFIDKSLREILSKPYLNYQQTAHPIRIWAVAFSADGQTLATGSADGTVKLWHTNTLTVEHTLSTPTQQPIYALAFSHNTQHLAVADAEGTVWLWTLADLTPPTPLLNPAKHVLYTLAFSPKTNLLAAAGYSKTVYIWDTSNLQAPSLSLSTTHSQIRAIAFSGDGQQLAIAGLNGPVQVWQTNTLTQNNPINLPLEFNDQAIEIFALQFNPLNQIIAVAVNNTLYLWDLKQLEKPPIVLNSHQRTIRTLAFSPDGKHLASAGLDESIHLWDMDNLSNQPTVLLGHQSIIWSLAFSPNGDLLASVDDKNLRLWQFIPPIGSPSIFNYKNIFVQAVAVNPSKTIIALGSLDNKVYLWDTTTPNTNPSLLTQHQDSVQALAFSPDGRYLASGSDDHTIQLWEMSTPPRLQSTFSNHQAPIQAITFSDDGQTVLSGDETGTLFLWAIDTPNTPQPLKIERNSILAMALSSTQTAKTLAVLIDTHTIKLLEGDGLDEKLTFRVKANVGAINTIALSPDGKTLATANNDNTLKLWDIEAQNADPIVLYGHTASVNAINFSADSQTLISASDDGTVRLWPTPNGLLTLACKQVKRNLSKAEWDAYLGEMTYQQTCSGLPLSK